MSEQPMVEVLLATFNGERFLREQIESVLGQTYATVRILARDDGSSDGTVEILKEYAWRLGKRFRVLQDGVATGNPKWNFVRLMEASTGEYLALCDQDDVWVPQKIELEMETMRRLETANFVGRPLLVFSDLRVVDRDLNTVRESFWEHQPIRPGNIGRLERLLAQNVVTGCTALMNRPLIALAARMPGETHMHDWWIAVMACVFGEAAAVPVATVLYRQHGGNMLGAAQGPAVRGIPRWRFHGERRREWETSVRMAEGLLRVHGGDLSAAQRATAEAFVRCDRHPNRMVRVLTWLDHGMFLESGLRPNLALLWYLWDMKAAKNR